MTSLSPAEAAKVPRMHPDLFTREEATEYLRLPSERTLDWVKAHYSLSSQIVGKIELFHREDLDACTRRMFGKDQTRQLRIAGGRR